MRFRTLRISVFAVSIVITVAASGCRPYAVSDAPPHFVWMKVDDPERRAPVGISVYEGRDDAAPLLAWYARVDMTSPDISVSIVGAESESGGETISHFAERENACLAVNAGYFLTREDHSYPIGLLVSDRQLLHGASHRIYQDGQYYQAIRAAIGILEDGSLDIAWVSSRSDSVFSWAKPVANQPGFPALMPPSGLSRYWPVSYAVAGGPALYLDNSSEITINEEIFFDSPIPNFHPRTAAGITDDGDLILMVVDGRQARSRGVSLEELALIMRDVGAVKALNMDGGGSSAMVWNSTLLNRPLGSTEQREVTSAFVVKCADSSAP